MTDLTKTTVLSLLSNSLFGIPIELSDEIDWQEVFKECDAQSVLPLAFSAAPPNCVSPDEYRKWSKKVKDCLGGNSVISYSHTYIHELMEKENIGYVILKGCASSEYYDKPFLRVMGDVDFYVTPSDFKRADALLLKNGFVPHNVDHEYEKAYTKNEVDFELHRMINGVPTGKNGTLIKEYFNDIFDKSELKTTETAQYYSPSPFHHGLIMLLHVARHMTTGGIGLRHFCDWAVFADKMGDGFSPLFEDKLKQVGLWRFAQIMTQFCVKYLGCPMQSWLGEWDDELLENLRDDVFAGGNFGHKDLSRADEAKFITSRKEGSVNTGSNARQALLSANEIVRKHWRFADKLPIVYPLGWIFFGGRYILRTLTGKRKKIAVGELIESAEKRKEIYASLDLFNT